MTDSRSFRLFGKDCWLHLGLSIGLSDIIFKKRSTTARSPEFKTFAVLVQFMVQNLKVRILNYLYVKVQAAKLCKTPVYVP